jgi:hypothetical protein
MRNAAKFFTIHALRTAYLSVTTKSRTSVRRVKYPLIYCRRITYILGFTSRIYFVHTGFSKLMNEEFGVEIGFKRGWAIPSAAVRSREGSKLSPSSSELTPDVAPCGYVSRSDAANVIGSVAKSSSAAKNAVTRPLQVGAQVHMVPIMSNNTRYETYQQGGCLY